VSAPRRMTKLGRWTLARPLWRHETVTVPARVVSPTYTVPAHETTRSIPDGTEAFEVEVTVDLDALASWLGSRAASARSGVSRVQDGILVAKVTKRARQ
jgi:hypothetical protein